MPSRDGRYLPALGGLTALLLVAAAPVVPASQPQGKPQAAPSAAQPNNSGSESLTRYERESLAVDRAANRIAERANGIAEAQRVYSFVQLALGFFGVGFTGVAAFFAWRATKWAKDAARANRPHMMVEEVSLGDLDADWPNDRVRYGYKIKNYGLSPAWVVGWSDRLHTVGSAAAPEIHMKKPLNPITWPVAPGEWFGIVDEKDRGVLLARPIREAIKSGEVRFFLIGRVVYKDAMRQRYTHDFVYVFNHERGYFEPHDDPYWRYT